MKKIAIKKYIKIAAFLLMVILTLFPNNASAKEDEQIDEACRVALETIVPLNKNNDKVEICDIYNVVNTDGMLDGYSLGYYIDGQPYGYAIYNIETSEIREFVFYPGVQNLYMELEALAEEAEKVDEDELIECVVYEGGFDYSTYDEDGNKVNCFGNDTTNNDNTLEYDSENIINSKYACMPKSSSVAKSRFYATESNVFDVLQSNAGEYYCIPDFGLAMITQNYITANSPERGYTCDVVSATGCLNYFGYLFNNNIIDTYNILFDKCITDKNLWGKNPGANSHDALKSYLALQNSQIELTYEFDPSFERFKQAFTNVYKEGSPVIIRDDTHSVLGLSCYEVNGSCYVGIWKNWYLNGDDPNIFNDKFSGIHNDNSLMNLKYFNYYDRTNWVDKTIECTFFSNVKSRNIKELNVSYASGNQVVLNCYVPYGTTSVAFPTWTDKNGQDDIIWHPGTVKYGTVAECTIDLSTHNKESGLYITHVYACDANGKYANPSAISYSVNTAIENVKTQKVGVKGYTVSCDLPTGTTQVKFPTWSAIDGQDDVCWYLGSINNGKGKITIDAANHKNNGGIYYTHIYAYDKYGNCISCVPASITLYNKTEISSAKLTGGTNGYLNYSCYVPTGTDYVMLDVSASKGENVVSKKYKVMMTSTTGYMSKTLYKSQFNNLNGTYKVKVRAYNSNGRVLGKEIQLSAYMD